MSSPWCRQDAEWVVSAAFSSLLRREFLRLKKEPGIRAVLGLLQPTRSLLPKLLIVFTCLPGEGYFAIIFVLFDFNV